MSRPGYLADESVQDRERELERQLSAIERADLEDVLKTPQGRRLYYRVVFLLCGLYGESFEAAIKDGLCAALHMARNEGARWVGTVLAREAQELCPDLWNQMLQDRVAAALEEGRKRREARTPTSSTENDG